MSTTSAKDQKTAAKGDATGDKSVDTLMAETGFHKAFEGMHAK